MSTVTDTIHPESQSTRTQRKCVSVSKDSTTQIIMNKLKPRLHTQYIQNPTPVRTKVEYTPGYRHRTPISEYKSVSVPYTIRIVTPHSTLLYSNIALPDTQTQDVWAAIEKDVFTLFENDPVIYGKLNGLTCTRTGIYYPFNQHIPAREGTFTPNVTF